MDYKNLLLRFIFSIFLFCIYVFSINNNNFLLIIGCLLYLIIFYEIYRYFNKFFIIITIYIAVSFLCFIFYIFNFFDQYSFNLLVSVVIIFDTFGYITGSFFGKTYIFKKISPNKTLEGYLGGVFCTNILIFLFIFYFLNINFLTDTLFLINSLIIFSFLGDLIQSYFKRKNKIKNSSNLLPGHGGFFDRFDSFIFAMFFLFAYNYI